MSNLDNVIDLCSIRRHKYPSRDEIVSHLESMSKLLDPIHSDVAASLLEMFEADLLDVTRDQDGEFLYALRKEDAESGRSGTVQDIRTTARHDGVAQGVCDETPPNSNSE